MNLFLNKKNIVDSVILFPVLWAFTGMFLYSDGKKLMVGFVILSLLISLFSYGKKTVLTNIKTNKLLWILITYILFSFFAKAYYGYSSSLMRASVCLFIYLAILPIGLSNKINLKYLIFIGIFTALLYVVEQVFVLNNGREWSINPIPYATFSASLSAVAFYYLLECRSVRSSLLWLSALTLAVIPLLFSQTRGLWLALLIVILIIFIRSLFIRKNSVYFLIPLLIISSFAYYFSHEKITQRITQTKGEIEQISKNKLNSSIGLRLQMWNAAIILIPESPIIGLGNEHQKYKEQLSNNNVISKSVVEFTHYHNQFLNELVKYGLVGFALLMLTIIYPLYRLKQNNDEKTWPGIIVALIFIVASLTDVPFQHAQTFTFYFIFVALALEPHRVFTLNKKPSEKLSI